MQRELSALSPSAVSYPVETAWNEAVAQRIEAEVAGVDQDTHARRGDQIGAKDLLVIFG